ncbi:MAG TPA: homocysteine S-methyltransferase family protein [Candidatus Merdenecus merdavium]|nr:homocysteine S-methyltransferase family protein [Candidatus Merdenecus merdavium]
MSREEFKLLVASGPVILDGATGSNLQNLGMPIGVCPEKWIVDHKEVMIQLQKEYVAAGTQILYAATFSGNLLKLREYGLEDELEYLNTTLVEISKEASGGQALVAGDITMTGEQLAPLGSLAFEDLIDIYKGQIKVLDQAGVDLLIIETMMNLQETRAAVLAAKEICDLPIMVTMTFQENGKTLYGTDPATAVVVLEGLGVDAVGVNCSTGPDQMLVLIEEMKQYASIPLIAKPNAGLPCLDDHGNTAYDMEIDDFVYHTKALVSAGASIVGGCCGTTPAFISALVKEVKDMEVMKPNPSKKRTLASERKTIEIDLDGPMLIVGEKINPTGKKKLQGELRENTYDLVLEFARTQEEAGASLLDVNVGMNGIDEQETMLQVLSEVTRVSNLPLSIDTSHVSVMEQALRHYPGKALINSISLEKGKMDQLLPLAKKYGAMFVLLPLSEKGLPKTFEEKIEIINTIVLAADHMGIPRDHIVVDGLVTTIGANKRAGIETLDTIRYCKEELGVATIVGLSNISFGLPNRGNVNAAFLTMAIQAGLTMAIADPLNRQLMKSAYASDVLCNKEGADLRYIEYMTKILKIEEEETLKAAHLINKERTRSNGHTDEDKQNPRDKHLNISGKDHVKKEDQAESIEDNQVYIDVVKGARKKIVETVKTYLDQGNSASQILDTMLIPGINKVSELFDQQKYFLPQLIASAEAMKRAIEYLEPMLFSSKEVETKPVIVIATVEGDIHDIGKNLVAMMLKNYGYQVIDLGKDVPKEVIVKTAIEKKASIIGLSALMTTTMQEMKHVIELCKKENCSAKVIIGGAVITPSYAKEIGAHGYSKDASEAVKLVKTLLEK